MSKWNKKMIELLTDLWDYSELPYRCPRCGNSKNFPTLSSLKSHLEVDHAYRSPNRARSNSPLLECYSREAKELEKQLREAKDAETRNHTMRNSLKNYYDDINSLSDQIIKSKHNQWNTSDALADAKEQIEKLSRDADKSHVGLINRLQEDLNEKESSLQKATNELQELNTDRRRLKNEVQELKNQNNSSVDNLGKLRSSIRQKDELVQQKEKEIQEMAEFLQMTALKEEVARKKLEDFIGNLLQRTEKAEGELAVIKSLNTTPQNTMQRSNSLPQSPHPHMNNPVQRSSSAVSSRPAFQPLMNGVNGPGMGQVSSSSYPSANHHLSRPVPPLLTTPKPHPLTPPHHSPGSIPRQTPLMFSESTSDPTVSAENPYLFRNIPYEEVIEQQMTSPVQGRPHSARSQRTGNSMNYDPIQEEMIIPTHKPLQVQTQAQPNGFYYPSNGAMTDLLTDYPTSSEPSFSKTGRTFPVDENGIMWDTSSEVLDDPQYNSYQNYLSLDDLEKDLDEALTLSYDLEPQLIDDYEDDVGDDDFEKKPVKKKSPVNSRDDSRKKQLEAEKQKRYHDTLFCIFMYLDTKTLSQLSAVNKQWRDISRHPALWRKVELIKEKMSSKFLITISQWCTQLQSLTLEGIRARSRKPNETTDEYRAVTRGCLEYGLEQLLQVSQHSLVSLRIVDCGHIFTDRALWLASCHSRHLQRVAYVSDTDPVGAEVIWALGAGCRQIQTLIVPPMYPNERPEKFTNRCAYMIGRCWPQLQVLCIGGVEVDIRGLVSVVRNCPHVEVLELDHMCEITEDTAMSMCHAGLNQLQAIDFTFTPVTPKALLQFKNACEKLTSICVHIGISDYFEDTQRPQHIDEYNQIINKLKSLKRRPEFVGVLKIKADYG